VTDRRHLYGPNHRPCGPDVRREPVYVYGLADPDSGVIHYVGKSAHPHVRLRAAVYGTGSKALSEWIRSLNRKPRIVLLKRVAPGDDAGEHERHLIEVLHLCGQPLVNVLGVDRKYPWARAA
jgi:hypothetical protein